MIISINFFDEKPLPVTNIIEEAIDVIDDSQSQDEEQNTFMDETTSRINEAGVNEFIQDFYRSYEEVTDSPIAQLAKTPLFPSAKTSILATLMLLLNLKVMHGLTNTCFIDILRYDLIFLYINVLSCLQILKCFVYL